MPLLIRSFRDVADATFLLAALALALISAVLISTTVRDHLRNYKFPSLQMCCLRILALAPVYAILSWLMMVLLPLAPFIEVFRDIYETYALYCYWVLLVLWVGGQHRVIGILAEGGSSMSDCMLCPLLPAHGLPKFTGVTVARFQSATFHFRYWRLAIFQWMVVKPSLTLIHSILVALQMEGLNRTRLLTLVSTCVGMHAVLDTYSCLLPHLKGLQGSMKFLCIKLVVGVTLFQQMCFSALLGYGAIPSEAHTHGYSAAERAQRLLSTITIVEMAIFRSLQRADSDSAGHVSALPDKDKDSHKVSQAVFQHSSNSKAAGETDPRMLQVMHGAARPPTSSNSDVISRPAGRGTQPEGSSGNWDLDIEMEDDHNDRVSFHQVLALWDVVVWRTVEDRHAWAMAGRSSPPPEREGTEVSPSTKRAAE